MDMSRFLGETLGIDQPDIPDPDVSSCEATLPSSSAVDRLVRGEVGAIPAVIASTALRGALIAGGMYALGGIRDWRTLVRGGAGGAVGIEVFVVGWVWWQHHQREKQAAAAKTTPQLPPPSTSP